MADQTNSSSDGRRSAVYSYLRPVIAGRRVLEIGCGNGNAAALLLRLGAGDVIAAGTAQEISTARTRHREAGLAFASIGAGRVDTTGAFDVVLVPDAADLLRGRGAVKLPGLLSLVAPGGRLVCLVGNGDQGEGVAYFDVVDALAPHFPKVRMFGQTPFHAYGIAEFDEAPAELRVESELVEDQVEPSHYIAVAGPDEPLSLGYALVQIPAPPVEVREVQVPAPAPAPVVAPKTIDPAVAELRKKLTESEGKAEGLVRVSRAQTEEIEELRARLRRTAEARAELDEEVARLRKALIEADESVVNLTRKTTEEMTALAQRLTSGLRASTPAPSPALTEELRRREAELAECESALSERDDRIAALEIAKQEALWRADASDDELGRVRAELARVRTQLASLQEAQEKLRTASRIDSETAAKLKAQDVAIEEFRRAAAAHVDEVNRLRDAANEQASLVTELEDELRQCEKRLGEKVAEAAQFQKMLGEVEDAERVRRSRLSELEGLMLRAEHASAKQNESRGQDRADLDNLRARLATCQAESERLRTRVAEAEKTVAEAAEALRTDTQAGDLEAELKAYRDRDQRLVELRAEAPDPEEVYERLFDLETQYQAATMAAARVPELEARIAELEARISGRG
jgi:protein-L-isoaspartate O-methyltransferase/flagellin-like hook-associated protein FlgL